jgi:hypothetical protein
MKTLAREGDAQEILRRLQTLRPDSARRWGRMSAHQMVCHLNDSFRMAAGEKPCAYTDRPVPGIVVKWIALYAPFRWPEGIATVPEVDQECGGTRPLEFSSDLAETARHVRRCSTRSITWAVTHPIFGGMSERDWLRWGYLHADHHLRQFGA